MRVAIARLAAALRRARSASPMAAGKRVNGFVGRALSGRRRDLPIELPHHPLHHDTRVEDLSLHPLAHRRGRLRGVSRKRLHPAEPVLVVLRRLEADLARELPGRLDPPLRRHRDIERAASPLRVEPERPPFDLKRVVALEERAIELRGGSEVRFGDRPNAGEELGGVRGAAREGGFGELGPEVVEATVADRGREGGGLAHAIGPSVGEELGEGVLDRGVGDGGGEGGG